MGAALSAYQSLNKLPSVERTNWTRDQSGISKSAAEGRNSRWDLSGNVCEGVVQFAVNGRQLLTVTVMLIDRNEDFVHQVHCFMHTSLQQTHNTFHKYLPKSYWKLGDFTFWISLSLKPNFFGLRPNLIQKVKWRFWFGFSESLSGNFRWAAQRKFPFSDSLSPNQKRHFTF